MQGYGYGWLQGYSQVISKLVLLAGQGILPCQLSSLFEPDFPFIAINSNGFFVSPVHAVRCHL
jgi:hypothetical protein